MNASESSPSEGHEFDGESDEQIVRTLLEQRVDAIREQLHEAVVEAKSELRADGDVYSVMNDLGAELDHAQYGVAEALEALEDDE